MGGSALNLLTGQLLPGTPVSYKLISPLPYEPDEPIAKNLWTSAKIIGDIQSVLGLVLLFLLGLGLRDRFRMK